MTIFKKAAVLAMLLLAFGTVFAKTPIVPIYNEDTLNIVVNNVHRSFIIRLKDISGSTGIHWNKPIYDNTLFRLADHYTSPNDSGLIGSPATETWEFSAIEESKEMKTTQITFSQTGPAGGIEGDPLVFDLTLNKTIE